MSENRNEARTVVTPEYRAAFENLHKPKGFDGGTPKYSVVMLFPETADLSDLEAAAKIAAEDKWGENIPKGIKSPFRDGTAYNDERESEGKDRLDGYDGHTFVTVTSIEKPPLVDQNVHPIMRTDVFFAGCYARSQVYAHAYATKGNKGITFFLNMTQKVRDGEPFVGNRSANNVFDKIAPQGGKKKSGSAGDFLS